MVMDFSKTSIEYNTGFIDGILWLLHNANKIAPYEIVSIVQDAMEANEEIMNEDEKRIKCLTKTDLCDIL